MYTFLRELLGGYSHLSGWIFLLGFIPIILKTWRERHSTAKKPNPVAWAIWAIVDTTTLLIMFINGENVSQVAGATAGAWIVLGLTLKYGRSSFSELTGFERTCLTLGVAAIMAWLMIGSTAGLVFSLSAVAIAAFPIYWEELTSPGGESKLAWLLWTFSGPFAIAGAQSFTFTALAQPVTFFTVDAVMMVIFFWNFLGNVGDVPVHDR